MTSYEMAELLKDRGFKIASNPFEKAVQGNIVLVLASTVAAADMAQRSFYKKLGNTDIDFRANKRKILFKNGGRLEICTPSTNPSFFEGMDQERTFYSLYRN